MKLGISMVGPVALLIGCTGHSDAPINHTPPEIPDVECAAACTRLNELDCSEGEDVNACIALCIRVQKSNYLRLPVAAVAAAQSVFAIRELGIECR